MIRSTESMTASENPGRMQQLEKNLQADDVRILLGSRDTVAKYLSLGRKWGFFAVNEKASEAAGRQVMRNIFVPESGLAVMIENKDSDWEKSVDMALARDPKELASMLLDQIDTFNTGRDTAHVDTRFAREQLAKKFDPTAPVDCVTVKPPTSSWPAWFAVIRQHELAPPDIENFYSAFDSGEWRGQKPDIPNQQSITHSKIREIGA